MSFNAHELVPRTLEVKPVPRAGELYVCEFPADTGAARHRLSHFGYPARGKKFIGQRDEGDRMMVGFNLRNWNTHTS